MLLKIILIFLLKSQRQVLNMLENKCFAIFHAWLQKNFWLTI